MDVQQPNRSFQPQCPEDWDSRKATIAGQYASKQSKNCVARGLGMQAANVFRRMDRFAAEKVLDVSEPGQDHDISESVQDLDKPGTSWNEALEDDIAGVGTDLRSQVSSRVTFMEDIYDKKTVGLDW